MPNNFNDNANKKNLNGSDISYTTYRTNYPNDEAMKENGGIPSGGDVKISTNTTTTVDVSTYTEPVVVEPAEGYDATKKVTLTLENIPSGGGTIAPYCYGLNTYDSDNIIVCDGEIGWVSGVYAVDNNIPPHNIDSFDFPEESPVNYEGGRSILSEWRSIYCYAHIIPLEGDNPSDLGLYEYDESQESYAISEDTEVDPTKTYYVQIMRGMDVDSVKFSNNGNEYMISTRQDFGMYQFVSGPVPLAE